MVMRWRWRWRTGGALGAEAGWGHSVVAAEVGDPHDAAGVGGGLREHPEGGFGTHLGRFPVGLVELGCIVDEAFRGEGDVDAETVDGDRVRAHLGGEAGRESLEARLGDAVNEE